MPSAPLTSIDPLAADDPKAAPLRTLADPGDHRRVLVDQLSLGLLPNCGSGVTNLRREIPGRQNHSSSSQDLADRAQSWSIHPQPPS